MRTTEDIAIKFCTQRGTEPMREQAIGHYNAEIVERDIRRILAAMVEAGYKEWTIKEILLGGIERK